MKVLGHTITIVSENNDVIVVNIDGKEHTISKQPHDMDIDESRFIVYKDKEYYLGMRVSDGIAESTEVEDEEGNPVNIKFKIEFPTLNDIFSKRQNLIGAFAYSFELDEEPFDMVDSWDLYYLFEGFFFGGVNSKTYVDTGKGWKKVQF